MKIERVSSLRNIERLAKIIFINFISLENQPDIQFSIEDIKSTHNKLSSIWPANSIGPIISIPSSLWGGTLAFQVRDPDGHALILLN